MVDLYDGMTKTAVKTFMNELKVHWTYTSNAIEGNTISLGDTAFIIEYGLTVKGKSVREHNEVLGHSRAIDIIYKLLDKDLLTKEDVFELHTAIQTNIVIDSECPPLDKKSQSIIEENEYFEDIYDFFKSEYKNSQILLDEIKR